ncbi:cell division protein FtsA [candidate division KSB1 bacterium]|nr:cell division protein FtsA [candidate division KSB1 bacterium]RQW04359.1 MAG: cell division protein FtsA [candidate division KSB1 bacterium]
MQDVEIITSVDIGTTKIGCFIAEISDDDIRIIGVGSNQSDGLKYGVVVDVDKTVRSIQAAVKKAEDMADVDVDSVFVGIAGDHIRSINGRGVVAVSGEGSEVTSDDVRRVIDAAKAVALPIDREIIHILPQEFMVDDMKGIRDPVGMKGVRLEAEVHIVTGAIASAQNIHRCIEKAGYTVADIVLEPLASSFSVLNDDQKELGCIIIDIGGGTSDIAMFYEGCIRHTSVVALGGKNVTNDLAIVLRTPLDAAEKLKIEHGRVLHSEADRDVYVTVTDVNHVSDRKISKNLLVDIIQPRMAEILSLSFEEIKKSDYINLMTTGLVLTGGGSLLPGTVELAEDIFNMPVRLGVPQGFTGMVEEAGNPQSATGVGLIIYGKKHMHEIDGHMAKGESSAFESIKKRFRRWFSTVSVY